MKFAADMAVWALGWAIFIFLLMVVIREAARVFEARGWGPTFWARLHWGTMLVMTAIIVGLLVLNEVRP
jgi:hypothetical protein